ncbi:Exocyst complex component 5 [Saguinus oedipus]|uniref:Exocyst complex component 5 n=1 Tax=Saguinus oedipus TaxID=9490 RepID=A0ABQ9TPY8_SAGOE|nr:Exocyst complex component 5 [Saguinus oedipus]
MDERIQRKVEKLEQQCQKEAKEFAKKVQELQKSNQVAFQHFQERDEHISYVAAKVCHLGNQLEGVNTLRQRAVEAQKLMKYFNEFLDGELKSDVFINSEKIKEAADIIQKLPKSYPLIDFQKLNRKLQLIQEFTSAQRRGEISRMKEVAAVLLHFKGYSHCVDVYIKQCQEGAYLRNDIFEDAAVLCQRVNKQVGDIFSNPETVLAKLIQNIFEIKLQSFVKEQLKNANTIFHLFDKQFNDHLMPLISSSPKLSECLQKKKEIIEQMEMKLDTGIDRTLNCMIGQMKHILAAEQKKTDFKPEDENNVLIQYTNACVKVCAYVRKQVEKIKNSMDGKNVDTVLLEFGVCFHQLICEHLQQYSYSCLGGMLAICDVAEYRKCAKDFKIPMVLHLFDTLHALCNLLVVAPDNLKQVCSGEQLANLDKNILHSFVQLCADYRCAHLARHFS